MRRVIHVFLVLFLWVSYSYAMDHRYEKSQQLKLKQALLSFLTEHSEHACEKIANMFYMKYSLEKDSEKLINSFIFLLKDDNNKNQYALDLKNTIKKLGQEYKLNFYDKK